MSPEERHREALADLDRQIEHWTRMAKRYEAIQQTIKAAEDREVVRGLEGRKRILQRHAPDRRFADGEWRWMCAGHSRRRTPGSDVLWEDCPDWRDAAGQETPG